MPLTHVQCPTKTIHDKEEKNNKRREKNALITLIRIYPKKVFDMTACKLWSNHSFYKI